MNGEELLRQMLDRVPFSIKAPEAGEGGEFAADFEKTLPGKRISTIPDLGSLGA
jgi:hypothetical protein